MVFFVYETVDVKFPVGLIVRTNPKGEIFPPSPLQLYLEREILDVVISEHSFVPFQIQGVASVHQGSLSISAVKKQWSLGKNIKTDLGEMRRPVGAFHLCDTTENWAKFYSTPTTFDVTHERY